MINHEDIVSVERLDQELLDFFGDKDLLREWVTVPLPILEGNRPEKLRHTNDGRIRILRILGEMKYGEMA